MNATKNGQGLELEILIDELEAKVAPDGGETVVTLPGSHHHHH